MLISVGVMSMDIAIGMSLVKDMSASNEISTRG